VAAVTRVMTLLEFAVVMFVLAALAFYGWWLA
jgi:hypothetical protein